MYEIRKYTQTNFTKWANPKYCPALTEFETRGSYMKFEITYLL